MKNFPSNYDFWKLAAPPDAEDEDNLIKRRQEREPTEDELEDFRAGKRRR